MTLNCRPPGHEKLGLDDNGVCPACLLTVIHTPPNPYTLDGWLPMRPGWWGDDGWRNPTDLPQQRRTRAAAEVLREAKQKGPLRERRPTGVGDQHRLDRTRQARTLVRPVLRGLGCRVPRLPGARRAGARWVLRWQLGWQHPELGRQLVQQTRSQDAQRCALHSARPQHDAADGEAEPQRHRGDAPTVQGRLMARSDIENTLAVDPYAVVHLQRDADAHHLGVD